MRQTPPEDLVLLLENLRLATSDQVAAVERRARRLARGLPLFASVWVDALVKVRLLTPFQAKEINAHRGESLRVGPFVLLGKLPGLGFAEVYEGRHIETGEIRRLAVFSPPSADEATEVANRLEGLVAASGSLPGGVIAPVEAFGRDATRFWVACQAMRGCTAADWMTHHGRFPAETVLEIARMMMPGLAALEKAGLCHGDLRAATLMLADDGTAKTFGPRLPFPGLRAAVRPREGYAHADLGPEAYDGLSPERVRDGAPPSTASDVYACGCLWWHMLTGRDPLPGGDGLTQLQAAERGAIADPRPLAPDAPQELLTVIRACTQRSPEKRPRGMAELAAMLGPATGRGLASLRRTLPRGIVRTPRSRGTARGWPMARRRIAWLAGIAVCVAAAAFSAIRYEIPEKNGTATTTNRTATVRERPESPAAPEAKAAPSRSRLGLSQPQRPSTRAAPSRSRLGFPQPLVAGQRVRAPDGARLTLNVPRQGLSVDVPGVIFENIDFVWDDASGAGNAEGNTPPPMLLLRAPSVDLRGCTFRSADPSVDAIRWIHPADVDTAAMSLPSGQVTLDRCVFRGVRAVVDGRTRGAVAFRFSNVLHLGAGPLVRLGRVPAADEPVILSLGRTTLRGSGPLVECSRATSAAVGKISIETNACVFSPREDRPLLAFLGKLPPDAMLGRITWTGQGSLAVPGCLIVGCVDAAGRARALPEIAVSIEGVVRSAVEFAGAAEGEAAASQAVRWLAPLQSDEPPGIDASTLAD